jgi:hypothetical protein
MEIAGYGLTLDVPDGWAGRIYQNEPAGDEITKPIIQAANVPFAIADDDDIASATVMGMGPGGVVISIYELEATPSFSNPIFGFEDVHGAVTIRPGDAWRVENVPWRCATFVRRIKRAGRYFQVRVVFGDAFAPGSVFASANRALVTFRVEPAGS